MNRAQRVDDKNRVICLVFMFTDKVIGIKISKMSLFFVFPADGCKSLVTVWSKHLSKSDRSSLVLSENAIVNRLWSYRSWDIVGLWC